MEISQGYLCQKESGLLILILGQSLIHFGILCVPFSGVALNLVFGLG